MLVRPMKIAPAARSRATAGASARAGELSAKILEPARVTSPATSKRSLSDTGKPSTAPRRPPPPHYDATIAALAYEFPADALIHALKFRGELALAPLLARLLAERISGSVDCVVAVPLSGQRLRERGYNQAVEIARQLGAKKPDLALCVREGDARPQMELPWADRQKNIRGAFRCTRELIGGEVALNADVSPTRATLDELARTLQRAGAPRGRK